MVCLGVGCLDRLAQSMSSTLQMSAHIIKAGRDRHFFLFGRAGEEGVGVGC